MKILPAIDLLAGRPVRLLQGDFAAVTHYPQDPVALARAYAEQGARHLHIVDLDGSRHGRPTETALIGRMVAASGLEVQVGGGIRSLAQARALRDAGVARVVIGSLAVKDPATTGAILDALGPEAVTLAIDVRLVEGRAEVASEGWLEASGLGPETLLARYPGLRAALCTDIGRDGSLRGPNLALYRSLVAAWPALEIQASGGVGSLEDVRAVRATGADGLIIGKALLEGRFTLAEALAC